MIRQSAPNISPTTASSTWANTELDLLNVLTLSLDQYQLSGAQLQTSERSSPSATSQLAAAAVAGRMFNAFDVVVPVCIPNSSRKKASSSSASIQQLLSRDVACQTDHLETPTVGTQLSLKTLQSHFKSEEDCDAFGDRSTQRGATSEILGVVAPGSSHMSSHSEELKFLSVHGKGEGPLAVDGHDTLLTTSEVEALNSLSADHSAAKSLERGERLVCREELSVQQTPETISIKVGEDIGGGMPALEDGSDIRDCSTQRGATSESLRVDAPGSSHMSSHNGELRNLSVYGQGEGPLAVDGHDTLLAASEPEALSSPSADHSVAKSLNCSVRLVRLEELTGHQGGRKGRPGVLGGKSWTCSTSENQVWISTNSPRLSYKPRKRGSHENGPNSTKGVQQKTAMPLETVARRVAPPQRLGVDAPGSSHMSSGSEEMNILIVHGKGEGPLAVDDHDTLFTVSAVEALTSLSADHSAAKSLERGERLVCSEELSVEQQTPDTISIKVEEDIGGGLPALEDCDAFGDRSTQRGATSESLGVVAPGSSHLASHREELKIVIVHEKGEGQLAVDGHEELSVQVGNHLLIHHPKERLPLLQLQHTPIASTHLCDANIL
ncbi:unnamed protein product [Boreogadus saida]